MQQLTPTNQYFCPVCTCEMEGYHCVEYSDYSCDKREDHHYSFRVIEKEVFVDAGDSRPAESFTDRIITKARIRFTEPDGKIIRLRVHYDLGYSEIWTKISSSHRLQIQQLIPMDFTDIEKLKNKLKTYLVFG